MPDKAKRKSSEIKTFFITILTLILVLAGLSIFMLWRLDASITSINNVFHYTTMQSNEIVPTDILSTSEANTTQAPE